MAAITGTVFRLAKYIDGQPVETDDLTPEQAANFIIAARHMIRHLQKSFDLPSHNRAMEKMFEALESAHSMVGPPPYSPVVFETVKEALRAAWTPDWS